MQEINFLNYTTSRGNIVDYKKLICGILQEKRLSKNELALKIGVTPSTIGNILSGKVGEPRKSFLRKLERSLDIEINTDGTFRQIQAGIKEINLPVIQEYNIGVLNMQHIATNATGEEMIPYHKKTNVFLVEVQSASMIPRILPGDRILVDLDAHPDNNSLVLILMKNNTKQIGKLTLMGDMIVLTFENTGFSPLVIRKNEIKGISCIKKLIRDI